MMRTWNVSLVGGVTLHLSRVVSAATRQEAILLAEKEAGTELARELQLPATVDNMCLEYVEATSAKEQHD